MGYKQFAVNSYNISNTSSLEYTRSSSLFDIIRCSLICVLFALIVFGNGLTLMAYIRFKKLRSNTTLLISSLAMSDLRVGMFYVASIFYVCFIEELPSMTVCKIMFFSEYAVCFTNLLHLLVINCERYIHIVHPFFYIRSFTRRVTWTLIIAIHAIISLTMTLIYFFALSGVRFSHECIASPGSKKRGLLVPVVWFGIPLVIISTVCIAIHRIVNKHLRVISEQREFNGSGQSRSEPTETNKRSIQTMTAVLLAFVVTWCPYRITLAIVPFLSENARDQTLLYVLPITKVVMIINSVLNPVIYGVLYPRYRQAYITMLVTCYCKRGRRPAPSAGASAVISPSAHKALQNQTASLPSTTCKGSVL